MKRRADAGKRYEDLLEFRDCSTAGPGALRESVAADPGIARYRPERRGQIDPRNGERVLYSGARRKRPHDTGHEPATEPYRSPPAFDPDCPVCSGKTTGVLDLAPLAGGHATLINKNLFPIAYPFARDGRPIAAVEWGERSGEGRGPLAPVGR
ncbi:MAG: hypothetical protein HY720_32545, partial [Planctomycetes bacterium]|nr:hypothetical protein [Planctomycetota bacterium]